MEHQISIFDEEPLTWFEECVQKGSLMQYGKLRIYGASLHLSVTELAAFLKEEYGWCGSSTRDGFMDCTPKGMRLYKFKEQYEENYSWTDVARAVKKLISIDKYLTDKEKEQMKSIQDQHNGNIPLPKPKHGY